MALYVNDERVDPADIQAEFRRLLPAFSQYVDPAMSREERDRQLTEWCRENVVERTLIRQAAEAMDAGEQTLEQRLQRLLEQVTGSVGEPTDAEVREYFEQHPEHFQRPEMIHAAHIVKHTEGNDDFGVVRKEMESVRERLTNGESFEALVLRYSDCPSNSGDLGHFPRGQMVRAFEDVVFAMEPGETSGVFRTEFGYHIARVIEKIPAAPIEFADAAELIKREMVDRRKQEAVERFVDGLKEKSRIEERAGD